MSDHLNASSSAVANVMPLFPGNGTVPVSQRGNRLDRQFFGIPAEILASPAWRAMSKAGFHALFRIAQEDCDHGGTMNGTLQVTYQDFVDYGIDRHSVGPAISENVALGFVEITKTGRASAGEYRWPNEFRITFRYCGKAKPTDEWNAIKTLEEARLIARAARATPRRIRRRKPKTINGGAK